MKIWKDRVKVLMMRRRRNREEMLRESLEKLEVARAWTMFTLGLSTLYRMRCLTNIWLMKMKCISINSVSLLHHMECL